MAEVNIKKIIERDGQFVVSDSSGDQVLGIHDTREEALEQLRAVEANKHEGTQILVEIKASGEVYVSGPISTTELDQGGDVVTKECILSMRDQINQGNIKLDIDHERWEKTEEPDSYKPLGRAVKAWIEEKGEDLVLMVKWLMNKNHPKYKSLIEQIREKFYDGFSIAYVVRDAVEDAVKKIRYLKDVVLKNVAITAYPMNLGCTGANVSTKSLLGLKTKIVEGKQMDEKLEEALKSLKEAEKALESKTEEVDGLKSRVDELETALKKAKEMSEEEDEEDVGKKKAPKNSQVTSLAEDLKSMKEKLLKHDAFKEQAQEIAKKQSMEELTSIKSELKRLTEIVDAPAKVITESKTAKDVEDQGVDVKGQPAGVLDLLQF